jgi:hypothetical protein
MELIAESNFEMASGSEATITEFFHPRPFADPFPSFIGRVHG